MADHARHASPTSRRSADLRLPEAGEQAALAAWDAFRDERPRRLRRPRGTAPTSRAPAGCRRTCAGAASTRARCWPTPRSARLPGASSPGASSTRTCCGTTRTARGTNLRPAVRQVPVGHRRSRRTSAFDGVGRRAAPATRSSTPGCGSCSPRAGCTTGSGWSWRASWSRTCTCRGGAAHGTSCDQLVDGDLASNQHNWQWVAGSGTDAAPYFRIFNPVTQGEKFDPHRRLRAPVRAGTGRRRRQGGAQPWELPDGPPNGYPAPIVDHKREREEALRRLGEISG